MLIEAMHLSSNQSRAVTRTIRLLTELDDPDALRSALGSPMLDLLGADTFVSMVWNGTADRFERFTALNLEAAPLQAWDQYYRLVDPITFSLMERRSATLATQILPETELRRTEFFCDFLGRHRMYWGINVYFYDADACLGDFKIWRERRRGDFEANDVALLQMIEPGITSALSRLHWLRHHAPSVDDSEAAEHWLRRQAALSQREAQVAWLVARGCPDKQIARQLELAHPTVRFHLGNAMRKLATGNRAGLAARVQAIIAEARVAAPERGPGPRLAG